MLSKLGARALIRKPKGRWPSRAIPLPDLQEDTEDMIARLSERKLRLWLLSTQPEKEVSARDALRTVSHLNLVELVALGGFCRRRGGWGILNASGVMDKTRKRPRSRKGLETARSVRQKG